MENPDGAILQADKYLLVVSGKPEGPYTIKELKDRRIKPGDFVRSDGMDDYKEAHEIEALRQIFGFAKPDHLPQYFAGFDQRWLAMSLDWFFVITVFVFLGVIALVFVKDKAAQMMIALSLPVIIPLCKFIYNCVMESSARQATYGKMILKIKVCNMHGERISTGQAIGRNAAKIFSISTLYIGYLLSFFNRKQQCLHDMMAGTLVIKGRLI